MIQTSIVIPVYNEIGNLPQLLDELDAVWIDESMDDYRPVEYIFVEDESSDGTESWIDECAAANANVRAVHLRRSWGQSAALAAGFDAADGRYIVAMDGDRQNDPRDIPDLLAGLADGADCVSGYRYDRQDPWHKTWPSKLQTVLAKTTGPDINDFGCTLKAYRASALRDIDLYGEGHRYIPAKLYDKGYTVAEVPVNHRPREHGESRYGASRLVRGFADLLFHWFWVGFSSRPFQVLGGGGIVVMVVGLLLGSGLLVANYLTALSLLSVLPSLLLAVGMVVVGFQSVLFGLVLEFLTRLYYREESEYRVERIEGDGMGIEPTVDGNGISVELRP